MSTSIESRIKEAEKRINELKRTESSNGYVAITNKNVVLPDAVKEPSPKTRVLKIMWGVGQLGLYVLYFCIKCTNVDSQGS